MGYSPWGRKESDKTERLRTPRNVILTSQSCNRRSLTHVTCLSKGLVHYGVLKSVNYSFLCILTSLNIAAPKLLFKKSS